MEKNPETWGKTQLQGGAPSTTIPLNRKAAASALDRWSPGTTEATVATVATTATATVASRLSAARGS